MRWEPSKRGKKLLRKARDGNAAPARDLDRAKTQQRELAVRLDEAFRALGNEAKWISLPRFSAA
jgi:hypothetical protein